jgi:hypothetical protein
MSQDNREIRFGLPLCGRTRSEAFTATTSSWRQSSTPWIGAEHQGPELSRQPYPSFTAQGQEELAAICKAKLAGEKIN